MNGLTIPAPRRRSTKLEPIRKAAAIMFSEAVSPALALAALVAMFVTLFRYADPEPRLGVITLCLMPWIIAGAVRFIKEGGAA